MKKFDKYAKGIVKVHKQKKGIRQSFAVMSLFVVLLVGILLMIPAYSLTKQDVDSGDTPPNVSELDSLSSYSLQDEQISDVEFVVKSNDGETAQVEFTLKYTLDTGNVSTENPYVIYKIDDENITVKNDLPADNKWGYIKDGIRYSGVYHVYVNEDGTAYVLIEFFEDYLSDFPSSPISGEVSFTADVTRAEDNNSSSQAVTIGDISVTIDNYNAKEMGISKSGKVDSDGVVTWKVVISNPYQLDMSGDPVWDERLESDTEITVSPSGAVVYDNEKDSFVIADGVTDKTITLTYSERISDDYIYNNYGNNVVNTANFTHDNKDYSSTAYVWVSDQYGEEKTGTVDYETGEFVWTVKIINAYGRSLKDFSILDEMFADATSISVTGSGGSDVGYTTSDSNKITISDDVTDDYITVTYRTPVTDLTVDEEIQNSAKLLNPDDVEKKNAGAYVKYTAPATPSISKTHTVSNDLEKITYSLYITGGSDTIKEGFYVTDKYLEEMDDDSLSFQRGYYGNLTEGVDYELLDSDGNGKNDTVRFIKDMTDGNGDPVSFATIYYTISVSNEDVPDRTVDGDKITFENTGILGDETGELGRNSDTTVIEPQYNLNKNADNEGVSTVDNGDGTTTYTIPWNVYMSQVKGTFLGKTYTDTTCYENDENSAEGSANEHYYNGDASVKYGVKDQWGNVNYYDLGSDYYTISTDANGGFSIYFKTTDEAVDTPIDGSSNIMISYTTTAVSKADRSVYVQNKASTPQSYDEDEVYLEYTDYSTTPYEKSGPNRVGINDLDTVTEDNTEYVIIPYTITYDPTYRAAMADPTIYIKDTLPAGGRVQKLMQVGGWADIYGFFITDSNKQYFSEGDSNYYIYDNSQASYYNVTLDMSAGDGTVTFKISSNASQNGDKIYITYYVLLPKEDVQSTIDADGKCVLTNTIIDKDEVYDEVTVETTIKDGGGVTDGNIGKTGGQGVSDGYADYSIDVNPDALVLSTDGTIEVKDSLFFEKMTDDEIKALYKTDDISNVDKNVNFDDIKVTLEGIQVYEVSDGGTLTPLSSSSYTIDADTTKQSEYVIKSSKTIKGSNYLGIYDLSYDSGDRITFTLHGKSGATIPADSSYFKVNGQDYKTDIAFDENGEFTYSVISTGSSNSAEFGYWSSDASITSMDVTVEESTGSYSNMTLTLPDGKHLKVVYTYKFEYTTDSKRVAVKIKNIASLSGDGEDETSENTSSISIKDTTSATSFTAIPIKLNKVNLNNININVLAGFNLYKYDATDGVWKVATNISDAQVQIGTNILNTHIVDSWDEATTANIENAVKIVTDNYAITLDKGVLYMIVEVETPNPYILLNEPRFFVYTDRPSESTINAASAALANVNADYVYTGYELITNGLNANATYTIKNRNYINVGVTKNWTVSQSTDLDKYKITVGLYRTNRAGRVSSLPTDRDELNALLATWEKVDEREISATDNWKFDWYGDPSDDNYTGIPLESGTENDEVWYYYVAETGVFYTEDGSNWEDVTDEFEQTSTAKWNIVGTAGYDGDHTKGTVNIYNTGGLSIRKVWQNENREELSNDEIESLAVDKIEISLYRSTLAPNIAYEDYDDDGIPLDAVLVTADELGNIEGITLNGNNIVLNKDNEWSQILDGLPKNDGTNPYYYYAKEVTIITDNDNIESCVTQYHGNGANGGEIFIYNAVKKTEKETIELPKTGGRGTRMLYMTGLLILFISFVFLASKKRQGG